MSRVLRTDLADDDLMEIGDYIRRRSGSVEVAFRFLDKIDAKCRLYAGNPDLGDARPDLGPSVRSFPLDNFVVIYEPLDDGILVLMVTRGARHYASLLRRRLRL